MLFKRCQSTIKHYLIRNSLFYIPITSNLVTNLSYLNYSKCAINQLNSLIHQYNGDQFNTNQSSLNHSSSESSSNNNCLPILDKFKLSDLINIFYILNRNMDTDNLVNSLRKCFKNENVNEIIGLHHGMMNTTNVHKNFNHNLNGKQFNFDYLNQKNSSSAFKKSELLDSSILSKFKHFYHNALNRLRFCSYHLKVYVTFLLFSSFYLIKFIFFVFFISLFLQFSSEQNLAFNQPLNREFHFKINSNKLPSSVKIVEVGPRDGRCIDTIKLF